MTILLQRTTFTTNRTLEFFSEKELQMQIGHPLEAWPIALVKELIDNALDACESAGISPFIQVDMEADAVAVQDNGPGLPESVLMRSLDYLVRVSDKSHYVSPTRGQLGNALKCVWAAPFVANGSGLVEVSTQGQLYRVRVSLDRIAQEPRIEVEKSESFVKTGTVVRIHWPEIAGLLESRAYTRSQYFYKTTCDIYSLVEDYAAFNPHATFVLQTSEGCCDYQPTQQAIDKWRPSDPTSPHWYDVERLSALIAAYLTHENDGGKSRTVREFLSEFNGLSSTAKQKAITEATGLSGANLRTLVEGDDVARERVALLLRHMKTEARAIKPGALGVIGQEHLTRHMVNYQYVEPDSIRYRKLLDDSNGLPYVLEIAFGVYRNGFEDEPSQISIGLNFSTALVMPLDALRQMLGEAKISDGDPICFMAHLTCPRLDFTDRGKTALSLPRPLLATLHKTIIGLCKTFTEKKRQADRRDRIQQRDLEELRRSQRARELTCKEAAYQVMEQAYMEASANNTLPANARQIMYAARSQVLALTNGKGWKKSSYFTQTLLPDFIEEFPELTESWDVVFDARGQIVEPHTTRRVELGTVAVRRYMADWMASVSDEIVVDLSHDYPTSGPRNRFNFALFIEKEGFNALIQRADIAGRYDIAIMSTKGMSVTAARSLVERLTFEGVTILVMHDFDKSGFSILHTLRADTRRFKYKSPPRIIDLGLRLEDVQDMNLQNEPVEYKSNVDPRVNLRESGATEEECNYLVQRQVHGKWLGHRVELNAMMRSDAIIQWMERKLEAAGVQKFVPDVNVLTSAYKRAAQRASIQNAIDSAMRNLESADTIEVPPNIENQVRAAITGTASSWDEALYLMIRAKGD